MAEPTQTPTQETKPAAAPDLEAMKKELEDLRKEKASWAKTIPAPENPSLNDKARKEQEDHDKRINETKAIESALSFNLTAQGFLKQNESIFPKAFKDILDVADREKYDSAIHKSNAIKSAWIQEYFSQQANVDSLTASQKNTLADYQKLTKNGKEEKAATIWDTIFEPSVEMTKRLKKQEELSRANAGFGGSSDADQALKEKMIAMGQKKYFGGKK